MISHLSDGHLHIFLFPLMHLKTHHPFPPPLPHIFERNGENETDAGERRKQLKVKDIGIEKIKKYGNSTIQKL